MQAENSWLRRAINRAITLVKRSPVIWAIAWRVAPRIGFLLPHEKDYFGLRHLELGDGLVLDVGANSGISALGFRKLGIRNRILSIEASRYHELALQRVKLRIPDFDYKILGAGAERARITLHTPTYLGIPIHTMTSGKEDYARSIVARDFSKRIASMMKYESHDVDIIPLDELALDPSLVKVDVEGLDFQVLQGLRGTLEKHRPTVLIEFTPKRMQQLEALWSELDYAVYVYDAGSDRFSEFDAEEAVRRWETSALQVNLFCVPSEKRGSLPI